MMIKDIENDPDTNRHHRLNGQFRKKNVNPDEKDLHLIITDVKKANHHEDLPKKTSKENLNDHDQQKKLGSLNRYIDKNPNRLNAEEEERPDRYLPIERRNHEDQDLDPDRPISVRNQEDLDRSQQKENLCHQKFVVKGGKTDRDQKKKKQDQFPRN